MAVPELVLFTHRCRLQPRGAAEPSATIDVRSAIGRHSQRRPSEYRQRRPRPEECASLKRQHDSAAGSRRQPGLDGEAPGEPQDRSRSTSRTNVELVKSVEERPSSTTSLSRAAPDNRNPSAAHCTFRPATDAGDLTNEPCRVNCLHSEAQWRAVIVERCNKILACQDHPMDRFPAMKVASAATLCLLAGLLLRRGLAPRPPLPPRSIASNESLDVEGRQPGKGRAAGHRTWLRGLVVVVGSAGMIATAPIPARASTLVSPQDRTLVSLDPFYEVLPDGGDLAPPSTASWTFDDTNGAVLEIRMAGSGRVTMTGGIVNAEPTCNAVLADAATEALVGTLDSPTDGGPIRLVFSVTAEEDDPLQLVECRFGQGAAFASDAPIRRYTVPRLAIMFAVSEPLRAEEEALLQRQFCVRAEIPGDANGGSEMIVRAKCGEFEASGGVSRVYQYMTEQQGDTVRLTDEYESQLRDLRVALFGLFAGFVGAAALALLDPR